MKIIVSPDSFKGSCSAIEVADSIEKAIHDVDSTVNVVKIKEYKIKEVSV